MPLSFTLRPAQPADAPAIATGHGQGVARALWQRLKAGAGDTPRFTVNSSLHAVPTYAAFGFAPTAEVQARNGVRYQPMALQEA